MKTLPVVTAALIGACLLVSSISGQAPQTHWEQYKTLKAEPRPDQRLTDPILQGAIDIHMHPDPDTYPRQSDAFEVATLARDRGMRGIVLKNHFTETAGLAYLVRKYATPGFDVFGAVTLDLPVGGVNPQAVRYMLDVAGSYGRIVWMPTHDSEHEVRYNKESRPFVAVSRGGKLLPAVHEVIALVAQHDLTLATGHVTPEEALQILRAAKTAGVKRLIVTHPMFAPQYTWMSIDQMRAASDLGAYIEITGNSVVRDPEALPRVLAAIRAIGASHFVVATDSGLIGTPNVTDTLVLVARALRGAGISQSDLSLMFKDNPAFLVGLAPAPSAAPGATSSEDAQQRIGRLEAGVAAAEGVRAVKRLQHTYGHYLDGGLWSEVADLFTDDAVAQFPSETVSGRDGVRRHFMREAGRDAPGLPPDQLNTHLILQPIVTLGADGTTAKATWHDVAMLGRRGSSAMWDGGVYENEYVLQGGVWKIRRLHYFRQYDGAYETFGHKAPAKWDIPYHFDAAHVGVTIPSSALAPRSPQKGAAPGSRVAELADRVQRMLDETDVQNLQHSFGYYLDRKLWDDVADLFASGGVFEPADRGSFTGRTRIREALETIHGAPPLHRGELFDHVNLSTVVTVAADGRTASARTLQLSMVGVSGGKAEWEVGTYENEFIKDGSVWKMKTVRYCPRMTTEFEAGWGKDFRSVPRLQNVAFHYTHPVTGRAVRHPDGPLVRVPVVAAGRNPRVRPIAAADIDKSLSHVERRLDAAIAVDAVENLNSSYGYYIDESDWDRMADTFATTAGAKEITGVGVYTGRERIRKILNLRGPRGGRSATFFTIHQLTQPIIHVSEDGTSAKARLRLFQLGGNADGSSGSWIGGIYENTAVKEDGEWKFGVQDLHHIYNAPYRTGWAKMNPPTAGRGRGAGAGAAPAPVLPRYAADFPPDRQIRARQYAFPEIVEPAFHYRNPVSGRMPAELLK